MLKQLIASGVLASCFFVLPVQAQSFDFSNFSMAQWTHRQTDNNVLLAVKDRKHYNKHHKKHSRRYDNRRRHYRQPGYRNRHYRYRHRNRDRYDDKALLWGLGAGLMTGLLLEQNTQQQTYNPRRYNTQPYYQCYIQINGRWYKGSFQPGGPCYVQYGNQLIASDNYRVQR